MELVENKILGSKELQNSSEEAFSEYEINYLKGKTALTEGRYKEVIESFYKCYESKFLRAKIVKNLDLINNTIGQDELRKIINQTFNNKKLFIFLHIPKTAGTSFFNFLSQNISANKIFPQNISCTSNSILEFFHNIEDLDILGQYFYEIITGHISFGIHKHLNVQSEYFTFLREPIDRIFSEYYYILNEKEHLYNHSIIQNNHDLLSFIESGVYPFIDNGQTRILSGIDFIDVKNGEVNNIMLEKAKENLQNYFPALGLTEKFNESVKMLAEYKDWEYFNNKRVNVNQNRLEKADHSEELIRKLENKNLYDIELYEFAKELFYKKLEKKLLTKVDSKMNIQKVERDELFKVAKDKIKQTRKVLDIGCGIRPQNFFEPNIHICCDPHLEYLDQLKTTIDYYNNKNTEDFVPNEFCTLSKDNNSEFVFINSDWNSAVKLFPPNSVDTIFLLDVIEHLDKKDGISLINETQKIANKQIIVFTPLGYVEQEHEDEIDAWGLKGAHLQKHKSGWNPEDFGSDWDFYICEDFHTHDNEGIKYEKAKGAFFAIKNISNKIFQYKKSQYKNDELALTLLKLGEKIMSFENDIDQAEKYFNRALELKPDLATAINNIGVISWIREDLDKSLLFFQEAHELDNANENYFENYIQVLLQKGAEAKVIEELKSYLNLFPNSHNINMMYKNVVGKDWVELVG